jgi:nicotinate-nucleotide adenylyltransferase
MRVGVFGGTFDPVHLGHLILAEQCREQAVLDKVLFVPAARPPHKLEGVITSFDHRAEMLSFAIAGHPQFRVDDLEKNRPGPSYTVETLEELRRRQPDDQFFLVIGSDTLCELATWRQPERIVQLAALLVVNRPGWPPPSADQIRETLGADKPVQMQTIEAPLIDIASRDIRSRVAERRTIRYLVPRAVEEYIKDKHLYGQR